MLELRIDPEEEELDILDFSLPDGVTVPDVGYVSGLDKDPPAGGLLRVAENLAKEPPPPQYLH